MCIKTKKPNPRRTIHIQDVKANVIILVNDFDGVLGILSLWASFGIDSGILTSPNVDNLDLIIMGPSPSDSVF